MNEHYVTSREWSERLKKAGVEQKSEFAWYVAREYFCQTEKVPEGKPFLQENIGENVDFPYKFLCASFLSDELAGMLPNTLGVGEGLMITKYPNHWTIRYGVPERLLLPYQNIVFKDIFLPNALASMVEYCKQKGLI